MIWAAAYITVGLVLDMMARCFIQRKREDLIEFSIGVLFWPVTIAVGIYKTWGQHDERTDGTDPG